MIYAPGQLDHIRGVAEAHPGLRLAIDHLGLRPGQVDAQIDPVVHDLIGLAELPNVAVKATCLPRHVSESYPFPSLHPPIRRVIDAFSPERVFWGSDLTGLPCPYADAIHLFTEALGLSPHEMSAVMDHGIRDWLDWKVTP
jgi:predicted TIM-barrel fold metal-dependent hydrolase